MSYATKQKYLRRKKKLSLDEMAARMECGQKTGKQRLNQYEMGRQEPNEEKRSEIAKILDVNPHYLEDPDLEIGIGAFYALFELERIYGLEIKKVGRDGYYIRFDDSDENNVENVAMNNIIQDWYEKKQQYLEGKITEDEYQYWMFNFPKEEIFDHDYSLTDVYNIIFLSQQRIQDNRYNDKRTKTRLETMLNDYHVDIGAEEIPEEELEKHQKVYEKVIKEQKKN